MRGRVFFGTLVLLLGLLSIFIGGTSRLLQAQTSEDYADRQPRRCRSCHSEIYWNWRDSPHARGVESAGFQQVWERARRDPTCLTCHSPAYDAEIEQRFDEGVSCGACHRTVDSARRRQGATIYHGKMSILRTASDCGTCHGGDHAVSFTEWQASAHNGARTVDCLSCHSPHGGGLTVDSGEALCGSCHLQPVPEVNPHMHVEGGCTDCHPAPVSTDNVHMHDTQADVDCVACHVVSELDQYGRYLSITGHSMRPSLTGCLNCHGSLHDPPNAP